MQNFRRVGINCSPVFRRLWTKVHEILGQFVVSSAVPSLSISCFIPKILAVEVTVKFEVVEKRR